MPGAILLQVALYAHWWPSPSLGSHLGKPSFPREVINLTKMYKLAVSNSSADGVAAWFTLGFMLMLMLLLYCSESFIMCQVTLSTTIPPVMIVCFSVSVMTTTVTMVPNLVGLAAASSQHDVVLLPPLNLRENERCFWPHLCAIAVASVPDAFSGLHRGSF